MEFDGKNVNVVDYKTGNPDNAKVKTNPPDEKNPDGGDYWRQAVFIKSYWTITSSRIGE